jgi:hypothetical protein
MVLSKLLAYPIPYVIVSGIFIAFALKHFKNQEKIIKLLSKDK